MKKQSKTKCPKYPFQRVERRRNNNVDIRGLKEQAQMEKQSATKISIGTFSIFTPKPNSEISTFTLAFNKPIPKNELYQKLYQAFNGHWNGEPVKSIFIHLEKPIPLQELRQKIKDNFEELLSPQNLKTNS